MHASLKKTNESFLAIVYIINIYLTQTYANTSYNVHFCIKQNEKICYECSTYKKDPELAVQIYWVILFCVIFGYTI